MQTRCWIYHGNKTGWFRAELRVPVTQRVPRGESTTAAAPLQLLLCVLPEQQLLGITKKHLRVNYCIGFNSAILCFYQKTVKF